LYKRQQEIEEFVTRPYITFQREVTISNESFDVKHTKRLETKKEAHKLLQEKGIVAGVNDGLIQALTKELEKEKSPKLHSLSSLQSTANKKWKYSPSEVLKIAQTLYEKKILSYPRTDSHHITDSEFNYIKDNLTSYQKCLNMNMEKAYPVARKRYVDNSKVVELSRV